MLVSVIYSLLPMIALTLSDANHSYQIDYEVPSIIRSTPNKHLIDSIQDFSVYEVPASYNQNENKHKFLSNDKSLGELSISSSLDVGTPSSILLSSPSNFSTFSPTLSSLSLTSSLTLPSPSSLLTSSSSHLTISSVPSLFISHYSPAPTSNLQPLEEHQIINSESFDLISSSDPIISLSQQQQQQQQHQHQHQQHLSHYAHQTFYSLNQNYNINKKNNLAVNNENTNDKNDQSKLHFNHDIESYYHQNPVRAYQSKPNFKQNQQIKHTSTTTPIPLIKLHNTKIEGRIAPTLVITLPKKRKSNGKSRRFLFLKAIVNSLISPERRANLPSQDNKQQKQHSPNNFERFSSKQSNNAQNGNTLFNSASSNVINSQQNQHSKLYSKKNEPNSVYLKPVRHLTNGGNSGLITENRNNVASNGKQIKIQVQPSYAKEEPAKIMNEFDDELFQLPQRDQLDEDKEEEFNEHSDAPRPHNYDENQYYIESNKIKYTSGRNSNYVLNNDKHFDHPGQAQNYLVHNNENNQHNNNVNTHPHMNKPNQDFESMTSEVIDQEENEYSDKRPSISVRSRGSFLISVLSRMMKSVNFTMITEDMRLGSSSRASCLACHALAALYLSPFYSKDSMVNAARTICISFRLQPARVCTGLIDSFKDDLDYIRTHTKLNRREMCGVLFGLKCSRITTHNLNWIVAIPNRPNVIERRMMKQHNLNNMANLDGDNHIAASQTNKIYSNYSVYNLNNLNTNQNTYSNMVIAASNINQGNMLDVVQITDIHVDPYYMPGSNAECGEPLCCRATSGMAKMPAKSAGVWGDYRNCDTPIITLRNVLKQISNNHANANYWMWTGDIAPHDIWNITRNEVIYQLRLVTNMIKEYSKVPVFPVIGNHEGVPVNSFPPPEVRGDLSVSWLYDEVAKQWSYWLPADAIKTLRFGGYYMVKVKPGFRIISLNTNYCTRLNPWTLYDPVDPGNQLNWLVKELHAAEIAGDKVHILGHIPPDNRECTQAWLNNFLRIIDRFEHIVLAQYYGHTHRDEFRVLYSPHGNGLRPISVAYIGPSVTPFTENNPAYRIYSMNEKGYIQDHHTYYFNLTEANYGELGMPIWRHEYSAMQAFPLKNLGPEGWHNLISRLMEDDLLLNKYHKMYFRWSQTRYKQICLEKCRQVLLNDLIVAHPLKTKPRRLFGSRKH